MTLRHAIIAALVWFILPLRAIAAPADFDTLHQQYLSLRNTDLQFARLAEWRKLTSDFIELSWRERDSMKAQRALFEAAILYSTLSSRIEPDNNRLRALGLFEDLVGRFPAGELADDALVKQAELLKKMGREEETQQLYSQVVRNYPDSDMALVASNRLRGSTSGSNLKRGGESDSSRPVIVLDPGHGGEDFGAVGVGKLVEKDVALDVALKLKKLLEQRGWRALLTRSQDRFVPLADRMAFANRVKAHYFVSIHANASASKGLSGVETYYLDNKSDRASEKLAERENRAGVAAQGEAADLSFMLSDLIQNAKLPESISLANAVQRGIIAAARSEAPATNNLGVKSGPFYVLVGAHMPCVLVEVAFIDHPEEGQRLGDHRYREKIAEGIAAAIPAPGA